MRCFSLNVKNFKVRQNDKAIVFSFMVPNRTVKSFLRTKTNVFKHQLMNMKNKVHNTNPKSLSLPALIYSSLPVYDMAEKVKNMN